jgi:hypothetical protein
MSFSDLQALIGLLLLAGAIVAGCLLGLRYSVASIPQSCTFDGGGTLSAGNAARTSDGHVWRCDTDGRLYRIR